MDEKYPGLRAILEDPNGSLYLTEGMAELALQFLSDTMDTRGGMVNLEYFGDDLVDVYVRVALERLVPGVDASSPHGLLDGTRGMVARSDIRNGADGAYLDEKFMEVLRAYSAGYGGLVAEGGIHRFQEENRVYLATAADMVSGLAFCALAFQYATPNPKKEVSDSNPDPKDLWEGEVAQGNRSAQGTGKLTGSLDKLTQAERTMVNDLLNQGKNVEIVPRSNLQGVQTPDFKVNGGLTELKTLNGTSLNTPVTRIQDGFKQGASTVIIDGRASGLTTEQANTVINRINGVYNNNIPGKIEIWTNSGTIYGGK